MAKHLKQWQGWILFGGSMAVVFILGLLVSSLMERRAEVASVFNNKRTVFEDEIVAQNEKFKADYPREYETWAMTEDTTFKSKYNSATTTPLAATSTPWRICARFCVQAILASRLRLTLSLAICSPRRVGRVRVRMCLA